MFTKPQSECALVDEKDREKKQKEKRTKERERETFKGKPPLTVNFNQKCLIISNAKKMVEQEIPIEKLSEKKENVMAKTI